VQRYHSIALTSMCPMEPARWLAFSVSSSQQHALGVQQTAHKGVHSRANQSIVYFYPPA